MSIIERTVLFIKNIFINKHKKLVENNTNYEPNKKNKFIISLRKYVKKDLPLNEVEPLICSGVGLGIQKKMTF